MKRVLFLFILLLNVSALTAQLRLHKTDYDQGILGLVSEEIVPYRSGFIRKVYITQDNNSYYLISQDYERVRDMDYDIPDHKTQTPFCLGQNRKSSIKTLRAIRRFIIFHRKGKGIDVDDHDDVLFHIHKTQRKEVYISSKNYQYNIIVLTTKDLKRAISLLR